MTVLKEELNEILKNVVGELGCSYNEVIYKHALAHMLRKIGCSVKLAVSHDIISDGEVIGVSRSDMEIDDKALLELKITSIGSKNVFQAKRYKSATGMEEAYTVFICGGNYGVLKVR